MALIRQLHDSYYNAINCNTVQIFKKHLCKTAHKNIQNFFLNFHFWKPRVKMTSSTAGYEVSFSNKSNGMDAFTAKSVLSNFFS